MGQLSQTNNTYVITKQYSFPNTSGKTVTVTHFKVNDSYEVYIALDDDGKFVDGTYKDGTMIGDELRKALKSKQ